MIIEPTTLLNAVEASGASNSYDVHELSNLTFSIIATNVGDSGGTVDIEASPDGTNWAVISTHAFTENGKVEQSFSQQAHKYIRANVSAYTDGTYTVKFIGQY
jgi:hypothetical protein